MCQHFIKAHFIKLQLYKTSPSLSLISFLYFQKKFQMWQKILKYTNVDLQIYKSKNLQI